MAYVRIKGIKGLVYVPDQNAEDKKHNCKDCYYCMWCSNNKCEICVKRCPKQRKEKK